MSAAHADELTGVSLLSTAGHAAKVAAVAAQLRARPSDNFVSVGKATPTHQPHSVAYKSVSHRVVVDGLDTVLGIYCSELIAVAEGQVCGWRVHGCARTAR